MYTNVKLTGHKFNQDRLASNSFIYQLIKESCIKDTPVTLISSFTKKCNVNSMRSIKELLLILPIDTVHIFLYSASRKTM